MFHFYTPPVSTRAPVRPLTQIQSARRRREPAGLHDQLAGTPKPAWEEWRKQHAAQQAALVATADSQLVSYCGVGLGKPRKSERH